GANGNLSENGRDNFGLWSLSNNSTIFVTLAAVSGLWSGARDLEYADAVIKQVESELCIDTSKVVLEGFSQGGAMSWFLTGSRARVVPAAVGHLGVRACSAPWSVTRAEVCRPFRPCRRSPISARSGPRRCPTTARRPRPINSPRRTDAPSRPYRRRTPASTCAPPTKDARRGSRSPGAHTTLVSAARTRIPGGRPPGYPRRCGSS